MVALYYVEDLSTAVAIRPGTFRTLDRGAFTIAGGNGMIVIVATVDDDDRAAMRVTRRSGDRYTVDFHELNGKPGVRVAAVAVPDNDFALAEVLDATGQVIESAPGPS